MREPVAHNPGQPRVPDSVQFRGHRGGVIAMHRALTHFRLGPMNVVASISLFLLFSSIWVVVLPWLESVCHDPCLSECMVIVAPDAVTTPSGSRSPTRMECAIFDRANPSTSSA